MSDTESFESVYERTYPQLHNPCGLWKAATIAEWLDDLDRAHDRELRDTAQREYHRGYVDALHRRETATWQLDRERLRVARRLREIEPSSGGFVKSLAKALGIEWTGQRVVATIAEVRDRLIELMGGYRTSPNDDGTCPNAVQCSSNSANLGERSANNLQNSPNPTNKDAETESYLIESADFNKLGERKATISKLERLQFDGGSHENLAKIAYAIYPCATGWTCESAAGLRDMLVRLLGGSDGGHGVSDGERCDHCRDVAAGGVGEPPEKITAELKAYVMDNMADRIVLLSMPPQEELQVTREGAEILAIADRIDEQFNRICEQQEAVQQEIIDYLGDKIIEARADRDRYKDACEANHDQINRLKNAHLDKTLEVAALTEECEMYQDLLRDARDEYVELQLKHWREVDDHIDEREHDLSKIMWLEKVRDELQAKLDRIRRALQ